MNLRSALLKIRILQAEQKSIQAQQESMANTLAVLEKELAGGGAPSNSTAKVQKRVSKTIAKRNSRIRKTTKK